MKNLLFFALLFPALSFGQTYSINAYKVAGGGGASTNARFTVSGTIGQPDANGSVSGGRYAVAGGFWSVYALQTPGAPVLSFQPQFVVTGYTTNSGVNRRGIAYTNVVPIKVLAALQFTWPSSSASATVQGNPDLANPNGWSDYSGTLTDNGTTQSLTILPPNGNTSLTGNMFFRLKNP